MYNVKLIIEYAGTSYCGWQSQKNNKTVQGEIQKAIFKFSGEKVVIQGAGRTDAGVHAIGQCANYIMKKETTLRVLVSRFFALQWMSGKGHQTVMEN